MSSSSNSSSSNSSGRSSEHSTFNPEATEFTPLTRMPTKRKASSSAKSNKSRSSVTGHRIDPPAIPVEEILGRGCLTTNTTCDVFDGIEHEIFELEMGHDRNRPQQAAQPDPQRQRNSSVLERMQQVPSRPEKAKALAEPIRCESAILYTRDAALDGHGKIRYLPLCPLYTIGGRRESINKESVLTVLPAHRERIDRSAQPYTGSSLSWPKDVLPVELFDIIAKFLSRDDIRSMRLVNKEFEQKVAGSLFSSSVVPFNTELYDMIEVDSKTANQAPSHVRAPTSKGKGRAVDIPGTAQVGGLPWQNALKDAEGKVYRGHGLRVFQGFGPHMRKFGMSFEVEEEQLARPPVKQQLDHVFSYHGSYDWPPEQYARFANLAGLERTADETSRMKAAFSNLTRVKDLALSVDNGLGWLNGPDKSLYATIFQRPSPVFGSSRTVPDQQAQDAETFWDAIQSCHRACGVQGKRKEITLARRPLPKLLSEITGLRSGRYADANLWSSISAAHAASSIHRPDDVEESPYGVLYTTLDNSDMNTFTLFDKSALVPAALRKEQNEWLMETDWAQRAFLECYMLAVIDNPLNFANVKTLTIAKVSSGLLPILCRDTFWDALPSLENVTIHVKPDWRFVTRDDTGSAETRPKRPSEAVDIFYQFMLRDRLCLRPSISKLNIGWSGGGEHAEGMFARNNHILPAPITPLKSSAAASAGFLLSFPHVEHLTLTNCWVSPPTLEKLILAHASMKLRVLTLSSVSLTAHPRFPAQQTGHQQLLQAWAAQGPAAAALLQAHQMAQQQPGNVNVPGAFPPLGAAAGPPPPTPPPPPAPHFAPASATVNAMQNISPHAHWTSGHREGSWADVLNRISPGRVFADFLPQPQPFEEQRPERESTNLHKIELQSCGYVRLLHNTTFDQDVLEDDESHQYHASNWFRTRRIALQPAMLTTTDRYIGKIAQHIPERDMNALRFAWSFTAGWTDTVKAEEAEYDGCSAGGTGRFSGAILNGA